MFRNALQRLTTTFATALVFVGLAMPAQARDGKFFLRGEIGSADSDFDFGGSGGDIRDSERARIVRGGYYLNRHFAVEGFYGKLYDGRLVDEPSWSITYDAQVNARGIGLVGKYRFGDDRGFFVQGRGGVARYRGRTTAGANLCAGLVPCIRFTHAETTTTAAYYGVGAGYDINDRVGIGVNYDVHDAEVAEAEVDIRSLTASLEIRF
jgi:hypothetical protein